MSDSTTSAQTSSPPTPNSTTPPLNLTELQINIAILQSQMIALRTNSDQFFLIINGIVVTCMNFVQLLSSFFD